MYINGHFLGALECRSGGGFHALAGCVAYAAIPKHKSADETPYSTFIPKQPKKLRAVRSLFRRVRVLS